ncbi:hypothetical protein A9Q84_03575 [Halobacteriovorax marinus]|uniref:Uncharacterized protein n=1 Tax=Halobacteriovorax marinus TaxID=97084 RepID=A0A1Y5FFS6_9BACT|nr:hypothetical protein A9Q84_03575 [Halobacteriovorax marinus]
MKKTVILMTFLFSLSVSANEKQTSFEYTRDIHEKISKIKTISSNNYLFEVHDLKMSLETFFSHKKKVCNGEFSSLILMDNSEQSDKINKLTKEERGLCFRELKALQTTFINNLFIARKNFLQSIHEKNILELDQEREKAIKSLQRSFNKKSRSKRSR